MTAKVKPPAILLMVMAGLGGALQLATVIVNLMGGGWLSAGGLSVTIPGVGVSMAGGVVGSVGVLVAGVVVYAAWCMMRLQRYGLVLGASIAVMVPCVSPCCLLGLPAGLWAILVLRAPDVRAAFRQVPSSASGAP